jgi:hypothetical protein
MQYATAYERRGRIFLHPDSKTIHGVRVLSEPVSSADPGDQAELGRAILQSLAGSKQGIPHPSIWENRTAPPLKSAGAKSASEFHRSARRVGIEFQDGRVTFTPYRNLGTRDGYRAITGKDRTSLPNAAELGTALLSAFEDAE